MIITVIICVTLGFMTTLMFNDEQEKRKHEERMMELKTNYLKQMEETLAIDPWLKEGSEEGDEE